MRNLQKLQYDVKIMFIVLVSFCGCFFVLHTIFFAAPSAFFLVYENFPVTNGIVDIIFSGTCWVK